MPVLLVVDDEPSILHAFRKIFRGPDVTLLTAESAMEGIALATSHRPDAIILDVDLPDLSGLEAFQRIHAFDPRIPVIFITGHGTTETAIEATKLGAFDYLFKPLELDDLAELVSRALQVSRLMRVPPVLSPESPPDPGTDALIGRCPAMKEVYVAIGRVAPQDVTVLVLGESGTGKELVARAIYHHSRRSRGSFRAINCAAIPETLLESELFGHEKGAFTGADRLRIGKFEQSDAGTCFLDEIGDMTPLTQAKILRVLQEGQFERVGGDETLRADVRIVAATNRNLSQLVEQGHFRSDLYYRLNVFTIRLPPLRDRGDDLRLLTDHFVRRFSKELDKEVYEVAPEVHELFREYPWPGNIRELQSVVKQALLYATGPVLAAEFLPPFVRGEPPAAAAAPAEKSCLAPWDRFLEDRLNSGGENLYAEWQALTEQHLLSRVVQHTRGNLSQAARILGINRRTLRLKLHALGIEISSE
ncbi:MAG: sigma-54-dependent Fis family transcriptional regulator [Pirellulales bacterium]|nr:sigma-54-dependent Fis family transcriptional regulator [Pirellulales bacterium]